MDFQKYLDKALNNINIDEDNNLVKESESLNYDIKIDIAKLLIACRKNMGLSQKELSKKSGISQSNISKIENGHYLPTITILQRLASALEKKLVIEFIDFSILDEEE